MTNSDNPTPKSFSFYLLPQQQLAYGYSTITPTMTYSVSAQAVPLTNAVAAEWFIQSVTPLVGPEAASILKGLIARDDKFLTELIRFRESLK